MTINKKNIQACIVLPRSIVEKVDKEAEKEMTSRSSRLAKIIVEHYRDEGEKK